MKIWISQTFEEVVALVQHSCMAATGADRDDPGIHEAGALQFATAPSIPTCLAALRGVICPLIYTGLGCT
jgi:hypothetical protein